MAGMTCTFASGPFGQQSAVEADRQGSISQQRVVEALQIEPVAESPLFVGAQLEQLGPAEQVRQGIGRAVRVPLDLGARVGALEVGLLDEEVGRLVDR